MAGVDYLYFIHKNTLDRRERALHIEVVNETFSNRVIVHEICSYTVCPTTIIIIGYMGCVLHRQPNYDHFLHSLLF
jgi:hypothetical protein